MERTSKETVSARLHNVNRRFVLRDADVAWYAQYQNGACSLQRMRPSDGAMLSTITVGTKREIADYLSAAMNALDDAND